MNIMMFNGLLFLLFMWTSAEMGLETEHTEGLQVYANESRVNILARKRACENLDGKCIKTKKDCPSKLHLETKPGRPYCSKNHRCCYPGPSCNLVWNYKEERPLIMIRESKIIVPPVTDISDNPNRIPIGRKLIFACPGENNQFNHVEGIHTKLYGECISHDQFKVCVNNNPEIEVCFNEKNPTTLCTSPNLNGNETEYRAADHPRADPQVDGCGTDCDTIYRTCRAKGDNAYCLPYVARETCSGKLYTGVCGSDACVCCIPDPESVYEICNNKAKFPGCTHSKIAGRCSATPIPNSANKGPDLFCSAPRNCWIPDTCPNPCFSSKHVCHHCGGATQQEREAKALAFTKRARGEPPRERDVDYNTVFYIPENDQEVYTQKQDGEDVFCEINFAFTRFHCTFDWIGNKRWECEELGRCMGKSDLKYNGHFYKKSLTGTLCVKLN